MEEFKSPYCLAFVTGIVRVVISYVDNKSNKKNREMNDYLKLFILVSLSVLICLFLKDHLNSDNTLTSQKILTGTPSF